jgi:hypothetical protein
VDNSRELVWARSMKRGMSTPKREGVFGILAFLLLTASRLLHASLVTGLGWT